MSTPNGAVAGARTGVTAALSAAARRLAATSDTPRLDAELLMAHALGIDRQALLLGAATHAVPDAFAALIDRRCACEPVAYIVGYADFWTIRLGVGPGALIPRADSETLITAAIAHFGAAGPATILDLGTGPGTLVLAALDHWAGAHGTGVDASAAALGYARANAAALGMADRMTFVHGGWDYGADHPVDLILCNPPYIGTGEMLDADVRDFEPHAALFAGPDGLDDYRVILPGLRPRLASGGIAILEIGASQRSAVTALAVAQGLAVTCCPDLAGRDRALVCRAV